MNTYLVNDTKFWEIRKSQSGTTYNLVIRYGNLDQNEEINVKQVKKTFDIEMDCDQYQNESISMKTDKGYSRVNNAQQQQQQQQQKQYETQKKKMNKADIKQDSLAKLTDDALSLRKQVIKGPNVNLGKGTIPLGKVMLAKTWDEEIDPTGYYMSEKLDGMRMVWTGSKMYSRNGNAIQFPKFFVEGWPKSYLDGELWLERDQFQKLVSITKKQIPIEDDWRRVRYMVFDAPGLNTSFNDRYEKFKQSCEASNEYIVYVPHIVCTGYDHLIDELGDIQALGGEGLMLRDPLSQYELKRSDKLLKVKTFQDDEATVLGYKASSGGGAGIGSLEVRNTLGVIFHVGSGLNDDIRRHPPKIGSIITYKYYGVSKKGTPRFPIYLRDKQDE